MSPDRSGPEKGPGLVLIHQHSGLTGYLKTAAYRFAQLGYTTVVPNLYHMLGYHAETHIDKGTEIQNKTPDPDFVRVIDRGWRYACPETTSMQPGSELSVTAWAAVWEFILLQLRRGCAHLWRTIHRCGKRSRQNRLRHPYDAAREIKCPSMILYGGHDRTSTMPIQAKVMENFYANGQPLEWHYFHFGNHGFASTESDGYQPYLADLVSGRS